MSLPVSSQMSLDLQPFAAMTREDFVIGQCNRTAYEAITAWPDWPAERLLLVGPQGAGKSHLGAIYAHQSGALCLQGPHIPPPDRLNRLDIAAVLLEDAHVPGWNEANLFHLLNHCQEIGARVLITSRTWPDDWQLCLKDLKSRLRASYPLSLLEPDETLLEQVLFKLFADRQLEIDKRVIDYLLLRMERSLSSAVNIVERLDQLSLETRRSITRQLAAQLF